MRTLNLFCIGLLCAASTLSGGDLATVGSLAVSQDDWAFAVDAAGAKAGHALGPQERKELLQSLVRQRLLVAEAKARRYDRDAAHKSAMAEMERQKLAERLYSQEVLEKSQVSDEEAAQALAKEPRSFDRAQLSQILVASIPGQETALEAEARKLARELAKAPKRFAAEAKHRSDDKLSGPRGGELGELGPHQLLPELAKAVFSAKAPALVGPVSTRFGWHLLQVKKMTRSSLPKDLARVKDQIRSIRIQALENELMERLAKQYKVTVKQENP